MGSTDTMRKLAAILVADVVNYSRLMIEDEERTLRVLNQLLAVFQEFIPQQNGRIFGGAGDSVLAEFPSAVDAVRCAVKIQRALSERNAEAPPEEQMQFRVGISVGDVVVDGANLMGDGVNIAARLESLAVPGGINISGDVYRQVRNKVEAAFQKLGPQSLKNIPEAVQTYRVLTDQTASSGARRRKTTWVAAFSHRKPVLAAAAILAVAVVAWFAYQQWPLATQTTNPSIAVLPFVNMSGDPEQDYFADGITDDLITDLTQVSSLFVISRDSSFFYKDQPWTVEKIARNLKVHYVLHGSVRRSGNQLRINAQLTDVVTGTQLWADRYDGKVQDIFRLQDEIDQKIVSALAVKLTTVERGYLLRRETTNLQAYEAFLKGEQQFFRYAKASNIEARKSFNTAISLDPNFALAYAMLAWTHTFDFMNGWSSEPRRSLELGEQFATHALELNDQLPLAYFVRGLVHRERGDYVKALVEAEKAVALDPNYANGHVLYATLLYYAGRPREGLERMKKAIQLHPHHPYNYPFHLGQAYFVLEQYDEAIEAFQQGLATNPASERLHVWLAASYARAGRQEDARWEYDQVMITNPEFSLKRIEQAFPFTNPADLERFTDGLKKAGFTS